MPTSSKVKFKLETLKQKALESIDFRIAEAQLKVDSYDDDAALSRRIVEWREKQDQRIIELAARVQSSEEYPTDAEIDKWKIPSMPEVDRWDRRNAQSELSRLQAKRSRIDAKSSSLVPDEDGNVSLTKTQLDEFFAL